MTDFARASALHGFADYAASQHLDAQEMLALAGLPIDILEQSESLISYRKLVRLLNLCVARTGNPLFGLQFGLHQGIGILGPLLYLIRNAKTVGEALHELSAFYHLHSGANDVALETDGRYAQLSFTVLDDSIEDARQGVELAVGVGWQLMHMLLGKSWVAEALLLQGTPSGDPAAYKRLLGHTPQFNASSNAWLFNARLLEMPLSSADEALHRLIKQHLEALDDMSTQELPDHVQRLLRSLLPNGRVSIEQIADLMMLSSRSLQRYLADEGTSFQQLLDKTRQGMAKRYLTDSSISMTQLASMLGYSDLSAFSRAFQRWFGLSPKNWQTRCLPKKPRKLHLRH
ncbi:AraC family transcriptional regulator [Pseudomonas sp. N040]|nr:AraC family transcriptional regulator [Pseudomonas sp. N040]MBW7012744.1 AraC family transcriptional regulator [Pseudomonas sp. N040]